ncbi:MAG: four helix bundle protein [Cryomorphaceae bacterium]|nr:MAG: four helix bundle protein [Cryomorphaceae bacterium]
MSHENPRHKDNLILNLTLQFSLDVIEFCELLETRGKTIIGRQLLRSATSIGSNTREAQNAESRNDFIHKLKVALKEVDETEYWLLLCEKAKSYPTNEQLSLDLKTIRMVLNKIVSSTSKNRK